MNVILVFFLGASIASFCGLIVERFPEQSIIFPASYCDSCKKPLAKRDLIPIFSQLINHSRCRFCQARIPLWYAYLELSFGIVAILCYQGLISPSQVFILTFSTLLSLYDWRQQAFPLLIWLLPNCLLLCCVSVNPLTLILLAVAVIAALINIRIGSGDFLYLTTLSVFLDFNILLWVIEIGSLLGLIYCLHKKHKTIPFIPFLFLAYLMIQISHIF